MAATGPTVVVHPPTVIRPIDATPMRVVMRAMISVAKTDDDFVLAAKRGTDWKLLRAQPSAFPVVPVPFGTGGTWKPVKGHGPAPGRDVPILEVAVSGDRFVRVMVEAGAESLDDLPPTPDQATQLVALLKAKRALPEFADRADLEISGTGDTTYGSLVMAIDAAVAAGFTEWRLTTPPQP